MIYLFFIAIGAIFGIFLAAKVAKLLMENSQNFYEYKLEQERKVCEFATKFAVAEAKNIIYEDMIVVHGRREQHALDLAYKVMNMRIEGQITPLPYYPQLAETAQNSQNTGVSTQQTPFEISGGVESQEIKLAYRGGLTPEDVQYTADGLLNCNGYKMQLPKTGASSLQFGNTGIYAGGCKNCNNRFVSKKSNTNTCSDKCHTEYGNKNRG